MVNQRRVRDWLVRRIAITMPTMPPPRNATNDSNHVQRTAATMKMNSENSKARFTSGCPSIPLAAYKDYPVNPSEDGAKAKCHGQVDSGRDEIELEGAEGCRLQRIGHSGEFDRGDGRNHAGAQHQQYELARQRRKHCLDSREHHHMTKS